MLPRIGRRSTLRLIRKLAKRSLCNDVAVREGHPQADLVPEKRVVFSGIQPTGAPHLGNYLGAIRQWVELQKDPGDIYYSIVDLHALTVMNEYRLSDRVLDMTACLLAYGIDPKRSIVFKQSDVIEHGMLSWVLSCLIQQNTMKQFVHWKEKSKMDRNAANLGLFTYPVLQSADILLYKATHVPVGRDQKAHLELCQDVAKSFNRRHGEYFPIPKYLDDPNCTKILSLRDPFSKMSKSERSDLGKINLTDSDDAIWHKIKRAVTDDTSTVTFDPIRRPGVSNLIQIHAAVSGMSADDICKRSQDEELDTGQYKMAVAEAVIDHMKPLRGEYERLKNDRNFLESVLIQGKENATEVARKNWAEIANLIGLS